MAFRFRGLRVYAASRFLHKRVFLLTKKFSRSFHYLVDQLNRASLSVPLNIAEGSGKFTDKDFNRYLSNSQGSIAEIVACLEVALDLNLIDNQEFLNFESDYLSLANQLGVFSKRLRSSSQ